MSTSGFYIGYINDNRINKGDIGTIVSIEEGKEFNVQLINRLQYEIYSFYKVNINKTNENIPIIIVIDECKITQKVEQDGIHNIVTISAEFYYGKKLVGQEDVFLPKHFSIDQGVITDQLSNALVLLIQKFDQSEWRENMEREVKVMTDEKKEKEINLVQQYQSNYFNIGYQVGGYNLIGIDLELRASEKLALHVGLGIKGYTAGFKFYPIKDSSLHLNFSTKDGGFGLFKTFGAELGGRLWLSKKTAFIGQFGIARITTFDRSLAYSLGASLNQKITFTIGLGLSTAFN